MDAVDVLVVGAGPAASELCSGWLRELNVGELRDRLRADGVEFNPPDREQEELPKV